MQLDRYITVLNTLVSDLRATARLAADPQSRLQLSLDFALSRVISLIPKGRRNHLREIRFRGDIKIRYRLNKGDLNSIREIWFEEAYRLPFADTSGALLDLGANIGMTSVWLAKNYAFTQVIAVEPDPNNAALVRQNLELNGIASQVLEAAIGPKEAQARFEFSEFSNLGRMSEGGALVQMITVDSIIEKLAVGRFALVKIDIEGSEQELFDGPTDWLGHTEAIIIEFHPTLVDYPRLTKLVGSKGFKYIPAHSVSAENMDCFLRVR
jgi:FkbM family methyltransferase